MAKNTNINRFVGLLNNSVFFDFFMILNKFAP
jgi:hypothetical protein